MTSSVENNIYNNIFAQLVRVLIPLIVVPLLTSGLGLSEYGEYVSLVAKAALYVVFLELGFEMYLGKQASLKRDDYDQISSFFWLFLVTKLFAFCIALGIFVFTSKQFGNLEKIVACLIFFQTLNINSILTGLENYKFLTKVQLVTKILLVLLILMVDFSQFGTEKALLIQVFCSAVTAFLCYVYFVINNRLKRPNLNFQNFNTILRGSLPFYGARLLVNIYQQSSTYFVSFVLASDLVAIYSIAIQIYRVGQSMIGAVGKVLYTSTVKTKDFLFLKRITLKTFLVHLSLFPIVLFYGEDILSLLFSFSVRELTGLSTILYFSLLSVIISSYWGYPALAAVDKENYAHLSIFIASVIYFAGLLFLVIYNLTTVYLLIFCIVLSDFCGMLFRIILVLKFKIFKT